ncbi:methyl farnesoate epoxidase [Ischnura elegans]|uniref:methyl farnesoate epoxidase n=1 Tax=Ischnura elegans TaxID=197161 RepID=UPI001ED86E3D|nr:methyl farnesoate epoxidase [Ischnura elegans]XP_046391139.1 methyl farnesoate epoxidase [Ischnura elegans]
MWMAVVLVIAIVAALIFLDVRKPKNFPPGPLWLPVVGSLPSLRAKKPKGKGTGFLCETLTAMAKHYACPLLGIRVGKDRMVIICNLDTAKEMLTREEFDGRPTGPFFETRTWGSRKGVMIVDGAFWVEQRRFVLRHLKDFGFGRRTMEELVQVEVAEMVKHLMKVIHAPSTKKRIAPKNFPELANGAVKVTVESSKGQSVYAEGSQTAEADDQPGAVMWLHDAFGVSVLNTLWSMMAGVRYNPDDAKMRELQTLLTQLFATIDVTGCPFSHFPFLRYCAPNMSGYRQFVETHQSIWEFLYAELEKHKSTFRSGHCRDFMDAYLEQMEIEKKEGRLDSNYNDAQLVAICMDLFMAGSETTSKTLGFAFLFLITHQEVQKKVRAEIDAVIGRDRLPMLSDRPRLPYTEAVVLECLRMFVGRSFGLSHRAMRDSWLQGYFIPKDTMLVVCFSNILMNQEFWDDPEMFKPERFIDSEGNIQIPDCMIPFGVGKRRCVGESLAKSNVFLFIAALLQSFEFSLPEGDTAPPLCGQEGLTPSPLPYRAKVTLRR